MDNEYVAPVAAAVKAKNEALERARRVIEQFQADYRELLTPKARDDINNILFEIDQARKDQLVQGGHNE